MEREEKLSGITACVLVDRSHAAEKRSLRWRQLPAGPVSGGILHSKVSLLVWRERIRVLVGSPNLTKPGYRQNYENLARFDFTREGETPLVLLDDVVKFLGGLVDEERLGEARAGSARERVESFLETVRSQVSTWEKGEWKPGQPSAHFVPVVRRGESLFTQVSRLWRGTGPNLAAIVSPFWDEAEQGQAVLDSLVGIMGKNGERTITFQAAGDRLPDGTVNLCLPEVYREPAGSRRAHRFILTNKVDDEGEIRSLHSKLLFLNRDEETLIVLGSSNFTMAGTGSGNSERGRNVEANVAYVIPAAGAEFGRRCLEIFPPGDVVEGSDDKVLFVGARDDEEGEQKRAPRIPGRFGEALFNPGPGGGTLLLEIGPGEPESFLVEDPSGKTILGSEEVDPSGLSSIVWSGEAPPSLLTIRWPAGNPESAVFWPVNVTDASRLPPPQELRDLPYEELLDVLASDLPLQEALARAQARRVKIGPEKGDGSALPAELDPHRRVNTRGYLLRRVKRVSKALEGLRSRLERPAFTSDSLGWRLHGPVGPIALAQQIAAREGPIAAFLIAEIALTISMISWEETDKYVGKEFRTVELAKVMHSLRVLAPLDGANPALAEYVRESFEEVAS